MKIAIHLKENDFSSKWIDYCRNNNIEYKIVDCYSNDIVPQLADCDGFLWHVHQANPKEVLFAKQLIYSLQSAGKSVFPDFNTVWHFDDKVGQKYLLEAVGTPLVPSYVFYDKKEALDWIKQTEFPKVFKLRGGAGSSNVRKIKNLSEARKVIKKAFNSGFSSYDKLGSLKERVYKYRAGKGSFLSIMKGVLRIVRTTEFARIAGRERGYVYFQDFIPDNDSDIRIIVIDGKSFGIKRLVREGDFRASGSGNVLYERDHFDEDTVQLSFEIADKLKSQCLAIDYVYSNGNPHIVEISYGFIKEVYYKCEGYWDRELNWHEGPFDAQGWMVEAVLKSIQEMKQEI